MLICIVRFISWLVSKMYNLKWTKKEALWRKKKFCTKNGLGINHLKMWLSLNNSQILNFKIQQKMRNDTLGGYLRETTTICLKISLYLQKNTFWVKI